jgi:hypothetical protein
LGGLHLLPAKDDQISSIAVSLRDYWGVRYLVPVHCTGEPAFAILKQTVKAEAGQPNKEAMDEEDLRNYRQAMRRDALRALLGKDGSLAQAQR